MEKSEVYVSKLTTAASKTKEKHVLLLFLDNFFRRSMDILCSLLGLILLCPMFILIACVIKHDSPGPIFFFGERMGKNGKVFKIIKFRTMYETKASYTGTRVTAEDDGRITRVGKYLRDTKLNEFPQLWNVLKGEMSLVGPRPEDVEIAKTWPEDLRNEILAVRPGVTSPASVIFRSEEKMLKTNAVMDEYLRSILPSKLRLDLLYVRNRTILTDIDVIFWTIISILPKLRNFDIPENLLFFGPLSQFINRVFYWFLIDTVIALVSVLVSALIWRTNGPLNIGWNNALWIGPAIAILFGLINLALGLEKVYWSKAAASDIFRLGFSCVMTSILFFFGLITLDEQITIPTGMGITIGIFCFSGFVFARYRERLVTGTASRWLNARGKTGSIGEHVLVIGAGDNGELATWMLSRGNLASAFSVVGILDDDPRKQGMRINGAEVVGSTQEVAEYVKKLDVGLILYAIFNISDTERLKILKACYQTGARVVVLPNMMHQLEEPFDLTERAENVISDGFNQELIESWLDELEEYARKGKIDEVQQKISEMQLSLETLKFEEQKSRTAAELSND